MAKWKQWIAALMIGATALGACSDDPGNRDPDIEEPGNPTEDPDNPLDPTLPEDNG